MDKTELMILRLLSDGDARHGLVIQDRINDTFLTNVSIGGIYTALHSLKQKGLIASHWGEEILTTRDGARRRYYQITDAGREIARKRYTPPDPLIVRIFNYFVKNQAE
jgi:DNA-binding PadR family transcriptional regulator